MKIKNTKELKLRAQAHAKLDHVKQGTYGNAQTNGKTEYKGCAVGCLAVPHRKDELRSFIIEHGVEVDPGEYVYNPGGYIQRERVEEQFGIGENLMILGEGFFEAQPKHGAAIEFVKNFACSLNEGANFTERMVEDWSTATFGFAVWNWENVRDYIEDKSGVFWDDAEGKYEELCAELTQGFLSWLRSVKA